MQVSLRIGVISYVSAVVMMLLAVSLMVCYNLLRQTRPLPYFVALTGRDSLESSNRLFKKAPCYVRGTISKPSEVLALGCQAASTQVPPVTR